MTVAAAASWQRRIDRARELAAADGAAGPLLVTYSRLLEIQRDCHETLRGGHVTGTLARDLSILRVSARSVLEGIMAVAPRTAADEARRLVAGGEPAIDEMLTAAWRARSGQAFAARMILQPYAERLAAESVRPADRPDGEPRRTCPFCGGVPQLGILHSDSAEDGGGRYLLCATCSTVWRVGRFFCPHCADEDERHLPYFVATQFAHVRVDACDTCRSYLKTVDLTRLGVAEPAVDEVAASSLDVWAAEHGYRKIEVNLVGL